jgi:hypothetical protein
VGLKDLFRFSLRRAWAISSVSFAESIRRRVLLLTPLAIVGIVLVAQFQKPVDEQDAIRQTVMICLFATGMVVTLATIILACTNLPKEIENRVIYTVVTKPTTRLEIVVGKVLGFVRVSAVMLAIMGLFALGYLHLRAWSLQKDIKERLATPGQLNPMLRPSLEHYAENGLLTAKTVVTANALAVLASDPGEGAVTAPGSDVGNGGNGSGYKWVDEQRVLIPFERPQLDPNKATTPSNVGMVLLADVAYQRMENEEPAASTQPSTQAAAAPTTTPATEPAGGLNPPDVTARLAVEFVDDDGALLVENRLTNNARGITLTGRKPGQPAEAITAPEGLLSLAEQPGRFYVMLGSAATHVRYGINVESVRLQLPAFGFQDIPRARDAQGKLLPVMFQGKMGTYGQQIRGTSRGSGPVGIFAFHHAPVNPGTDGKVEFEWRTGIERTSSEASALTDDITRLWLRVRNLSTHEVSAPIEVSAESNRTAYFQVPAKLLRGGSFEVLAQCQSDGHWPGLRPGSLAMLTGRHSFASNLFKSLLVMWLLTVMVTIVAIMCSTFLSWPTAVVLTILILLGNWGVQQLGDTTTPGIGNRVATDFGLNDARQARVVSQSVEGLNRLLTTVAAVLPDISRFSAVEDIERGIMVPASRLWEALQVLAVFGLPMIALAYIFLKNKEVAP